MTNLQFTKVNTPNARLLYKESYGLALDWNFQESKILQFIKTNPKLRLANAETGIYFFSAPDEDGFSNSTCWVSREIIGQGLEDSDIKFYDLDAGEAYRFEYPLKSPKDFLIGSLVNFYDQCRNSFLELGIPMAKSWKVGIQSSFIDEDATLLIWLDFFNETDED